MVLKPLSLTVAKVTQVKGTRVCVRVHTHNVSDVAPRTRGGTSQVALSRHLVTTLGQSGQKCVHVCVCGLLRHVRIASHINVTRGSVRPVANRMLDGGDRAPKKVIYMEICWM